MADYFDATMLDGWLKRDAIPYFFTRQPFFSKMFNGSQWEVQHGKTGFQWNVRLSGSQIYSYGSMETFTATEGGDFATAYLPWGSLYSKIAISGKKMDRQGSAGSLDDGTLTPMHAQILSDLKDDFTWRLGTEFADGDGTDVNGGGGAGIYGYKQSVATSPATGTYANLSRVTITDHRNQQFSAAAGPSTSAATDAWWAILNGVTTGSRMMGPKGRCKPDTLVAPEGPLVMIKNKGYIQNQSVGASVNGVISIEGMEISEADDDATAAVVRLLCSKVWKIASVEPKSKFFKIREINAIQNHVHEGDAAVVLRTPDFQLVNTFPKANVAITSFS